MQAGRLKHRVTIQTRTSSKTGDVWNDLREQWAEIRPLAAHKVTFLSAQNSKVTHEITFRDKPAVEAGQRVVYRSESYLITGVQTFIGDRQEAAAELVE
jgi:SPP1 family predicted phage head-tail adaptor